MRMKNCRNRCWPVRTSHISTRSKQNRCNTTSNWERRKGRKDCRQRNNARVGFAALLLCTSSFFCTPCSSSVFVLLFLFCILSPRAFLRAGVLFDSFVVLLSVLTSPLRPSSIRLPPGLSLHGSAPSPLRPPSLPLRVLQFGKKASAASKRVSLTLSTSFCRVEGGAAATAAARRLQEFGRPTLKSKQDATQNETRKG